MRALRDSRSALAATAFCLGVLALSQVAEAAPAAGLLGEPSSVQARKVADWVISSSDNKDMPFVIVDKVAGKVFVFDPHGRLSGAAPALVGLTPGDVAKDGIGDLPLSAIGPKDRVTPAGRFISSLGQDLGEKDVLWVDYKSGVALHRVVTSNRKEHRLQRLAAASPKQHRISYGCINVPAAFYDAVVHPAFAQTNGVVYILPEIKPMAAVFAGYVDQGS